ncbi:lipocalin family protein [Tenacibaculum ovolyticum]|uniref:lipocalin family protein n=1 Tax=Tenacibaculum ovolyticum TaxID=104270 RepID=UPI003BAC9E65
MKKTLTLLLIVFTMIGCSSNDDIDTNSISIIGEWTLKAKFSSDGTNKNIDECEQRSNITFKNNNTFDSNYYRIINGDCTLEDQDQNIEYKVVGDILEVNHTSTNNSGQTIINVKKIKIKLPNNDTLETYEINQNGTTDSFPGDVWTKHK